MDVTQFYVFFWPKTKTWVQKNLKTQLEISFLMISPSLTNADASIFIILTNVLDD